MENFSVVYFIWYKRKDSFYYDLGHLLECIHSIMDGFMLSWYSIRYRSDSFDQSKKHVE